MQNLQIVLDIGCIKDKDITAVAKEIINGGCRFIQLRDKYSDDKKFLEEAKRLRRLTKENGCLLIINDRIDITLASRADGVHLGQDDLPYREARSILGKDRVIGISTHNIEEAKEAQREGADYIGVGPVFPTTTKPALRAIGLDIVSRISNEIEIPSFFIGGITLENLDEIVKRGARYIAVASSILNSGDIAGKTKLFIDALKEFKSQRSKVKTTT